MSRKRNAATPEQVRALLARIPSPGYTTLALVAGAAVQPNRHALTSSAVKKWMSVGMPRATYELVDAKLLLWETDIATLDEIIAVPLKDLLLKKWRRARQAQTDASINPTTESPK